ncbi:hypothetical protein [Vogesella indigofera]|uniref:hypothetical protein n=1 Tax=Vogesella indigofera TaxID=45465 RepID=UPI00234F9D42|nr:hypothetical protein [Vogesella indigofera]MDC7700051.1 hypothetical protein [Vogesella indigofera]
MNIDVLSNILLEDTFVLAWHRGHESLTFYVLASLQRTHSAASTPTHGDWACYRPGIIQFSGVSSVQGLLRQDAVKPAIDAEGSVDYGCIDSISVVQPSGCRIVGDFGDVLVVARKVLFYLAAAD